MTRLISTTVFAATFASVTAHSSSSPSPPQLPLTGHNLAFQLEVTWQSTQYREIVSKYITRFGQIIYYGGMTA